MSCVQVLRVCDDKPYLFVDNQNKGHNALVFPVPSRTGGQDNTEMLLNLEVVLENLHNTI